MGETTDGKTVFTVTEDSKLTANDMLKDYKETANYWTTEGQKLIGKLLATD